MVRQIRPIENERKRARSLPDPGDKVTVCSQVATPSICVQNGQYSKRVRFENHLSQLLRTKSIRLTVTSPTYPVIFSSAKFEDTPFLAVSELDFLHPLASACMP